MHLELAHYWMNRFKAVNNAVLEHLLGCVRASRLTFYIKNYLKILQIYCGLRRVEEAATYRLNAGWKILPLIVCQCG